MPFPTIRSVLVATDLSPASDGVVRTAAALAGRVGARLHAVHAVNLLGHGLFGAPLDLVGLERKVEEARAALQAQAHRVLPPGVRVESIAVDYKAPAPAILEKARELEADLIVMGPHSAWAPGSHLLGSTAERVVEKATVPCLVVKSHFATPPRRVLLPVSERDVRAGSLAPATRWLCALHGSAAAVRLAAPATELWALHVIESPSRWRELSPRFAQELHGIGAESPVQPRRRLAWSRSPAEELVRAAEDGAVDLVAVGVRGHGALMRFLVGSVSSAVLREAERSVLLFPPLLHERWARQGDAGYALPITGITRLESRRTGAEGWRQGAPPDPPEPRPVA
jgi:nucleotide-binding universal stress UspA family protein